MSDIPVRNLYYLLCYAWDALEERDLADVDEAGAFRRLENLFGLILARGVMRLARRGLDRTYVAERQLVAGIRGKLDFGATLRGGTQVKQRTVCEVDELSADVLPNRILASTLETLLTARLAPRVRDDVHLARDRMGPMTPLRITDHAFRTVHPAQSRRAYRFLLGLCQLLHRSLLVSPEEGETRFQGIDLERLTMWRIFELFVARFYRREQSLFRVHPQRQLRWSGLDGPSDSVSRVPVMRPDLLLESRDRRILLDTKYYGKALRESHGATKVREGHLYQIFAYVMNRQKELPDGPPHEGLLLYPTVNERIQIDFQTHGHWIRVRSVDLGREWRGVEEEMGRVFHAAGAPDCAGADTQPESAAPPPTIG